MTEVSITHRNIDEMLRKFFDGATNRAEEIALEQYFLTTEDIPEKYRPYRDMFGWYASGMDEEKLPKTAKPQAPSLWRKIVWGVSIAAAVTLLFLIPGGLKVSAAADISRYEGSFVIRDGVIMSLSPELQPEIEALLEDASCLEQEIDFRMSELTCYNNEL